jgi:hypothetical protein
VTYKVNYQKTVNDGLVEIEGTLKPYDTGRAIEYEFEPDGWFADPAHQQYYSDNWEQIQDEILNAFSSKTI